MYAQNTQGDQNTVETEVGFACQDEEKGKCRVAWENEHWVGSLESEFHARLSLTPHMALGWSVHHSGLQSPYLFNGDNIT